MIPPLLYASSSGWAQIDRMVPSASGSEMTVMVPPRSVDRMRSPQYVHHMARGIEDGSTDPDVTEGFTSVDPQPDPDQLVDAMLATAQWPAVRLLRTWEWDHLAPRAGETALDVGCGRRRGHRARGCRRRRAEP